MYFFLLDTLIYRHLVMNQTSYIFRVHTKKDNSLIKIVWARKSVDCIDKTAPFTVKESLVFIYFNGESSTGQLDSMLESCNSPVQYSLFV